MMMVEIKLLCAEQSKQTDQQGFILTKQMRIKSSFSKYDVEEGFEEHQKYPQQILEVDKQLTPGYLISQSKEKSKTRSSTKKQQTKLRYISIQRQKSCSEHYAYLKQEQEKIIHKSLTLNKEEKSFFNIKKKNKITRPLSKISPLDNFSTTIIKLNRSQIGQNLQINSYNSVQVETIKGTLLSQGASIIFQTNRQSNSHALFKKFLKQKNPNNFLRSKYNASILQKINSSYINPKSEISSKLSQLTAKKGLDFVSDFQSSNLDFVTQINPFQYDIYIKADTNSMGHQNWFYFKLFNYSEDKKNIFLNVCNLKRGFKMVKKGQKLFYRFRKTIKNQLKTSIQNEDQQWSEWQKISDEVKVCSHFLHTNNQSNKKKVYKLSFSSTLLPQTQYQFSLLPPFTYSQMLKQIEGIQKTFQHAYVQTLTYSLLGLCIPVITFTNKNVPDQGKNVVLISARIHPGETCASYVSRGVLKKLSQNSEQNLEFLSHHLIKIIPMINPDGVVLGNFRTNYLGNDLNRSFNQQNQLTFPQVVALKQLGRKLKQEYKDKFNCFLDLHGHSSQKNIFVYGPNYDQNNKNYINSRFLPKTLSFLSEQFDYNKCTFSLEQSKAHTARGYFLRSLKVMAFTIESSYALFDSNKQENLQNQDLKVQNLIHFGQNIIKGLQMWTKSLNPRIITHKTISNHGEHKTQHQAESQVQNCLNFIGKIKKQLSKENSTSKKKQGKRKNSDDEDQSSASDTDGENDSEDIPFKQRQKLQKKFIQANNTNLFPRILRPAIIHPQVNPPLPLFSVSKISTGEVHSSSIKNSIINARIKKNRYQNVKAVNVNNAYTQYLLRQVKGLQSLRPSVNLMKLSRKQSSLMRSSNLELK